MKKKIVFKLIMGSFILFSNYASQALTLTIEEAVQHALSNSKTLKSAAIDLELKKWTKDTSWNVLVPSVSVSGTMSRANTVNDTSKAMNDMLNPLMAKLGVPTLSSPEIKEKDHWTPSATASVSLTLNAAIIQGIRATKANYEAGLISWDTSVKETERDIRKVFYGILLQQQNLQMQKELLENARQRYVQSSTNYKNGMIPELSALQAQVAYENQKPAILELEQSLKQQKETFGFLMGFPYGTDIELKGEINPQFTSYNANELVEKYSGNRLDIIALRKNIEMMEMQLSATKLQTYTPSLSLNYSYSPVVLDMEESWVDKDNISDTGRFSGTVAMNITNMLPFSSNAKDMKTTQASISKMRISLDSAMQNAEMEIHTLVNKLEKSQAAIDAQNLNMQLARKAYNLTLSAYRSGAKELLELRDSESQLSKAQLGLMQEKYNYISSLLDLEYAVNTKLSTY